MRHSSTRLRSSFRLGKRQSLCAAKRLVLARVSACAQVAVVAVPVQLLPFQFCPSLQRFQVKPSELLRESQAKLPATKPNRTNNVEDGLSVA